MGEQNQENSQVRIPYDYNAPQVWRKTTFFHLHRECYTCQKLQMVTKFHRKKHIDGFSSRCGMYLHNEWPSVKVVTSEHYSGWFKLQYVCVRVWVRAWVSVWVLLQIELYICQYNIIKDNTAYLYLLYSSYKGYSGLMITAYYYHVTKKCFNWVYVVRVMKWFVNNCCTIGKWLLELFVNGLTVKHVNLLFWWFFNNLNSQLLLIKVKL